MSCLLKPQLIRLTDRSPLGISAHEEALLRTLQSKHILLLHAIAFLPGKILQMAPPDILALIRTRKGVRCLPDLSYKECFVTYFSPTSPYFLDWIEIEGASTCRVEPSHKDVGDMRHNSRQIVNRRIAVFCNMFAAYSRWVQEFQLHISAEETKFITSRRCVSRATVLMVAQVEPTDVVRNAARTGIFQIVEEPGRRGPVKSYVNTASLVKTRAFEEWLQHERERSKAGDGGQSGPVCDILQRDSGSDLQVL